MNQPNPLTLDNAKDIVTVFNTSYATEDMVQLTVTASRAANFIEAWIERETAKSATGKEPLL
jgi:hypothetical protein